MIVADGFFEWQREGKEKTPYLIRLKDAEPFAFAGLWSTQRPADGEKVTSYTIMTTEPNEFMAKVHNRMLVILSGDDHTRWLDLDADPSAVLKPYPSDNLEAQRVGNVKNNDSGLIERLAN